MSEVKFNYLPAETYARKASVPLRETTDGVTGIIRALRDGSLVSSNFIEALAMEGRVFYASDGDQNDTVTGQTSFANTTPTFLLDVPKGITAIPLYMHIVQTGTVAGGEIALLMEIDDGERYSTGGTAEKVLSSRTDMPIKNVCTLYSGATATAGYGVGIYHAEVVQDIDPAAADDWRWHNILWTPSLPNFVVGDGAWAIYTVAGSTGMTMYWSLAWAEIPSSSLV